MSDETTNRPAELTDEEIEKATGGNDFTVISCIQCPVCGCVYPVRHPANENPGTSPCPGCRINQNSFENPNDNGRIIILEGK